MDDYRDALRKTLTGLVAFVAAVALCAILSVLKRCLG